MGLTFHLTQWQVSHLQHYLSMYFKNYYLVLFISNRLKEEKYLKQLQRHREIQTRPLCPTSKCCCICLLQVACVFTDSHNKVDNSRLCTTPAPQVNVFCCVATVIWQVFIPMSVSILRAGEWLIYFCTPPI